MIHLAAWIILRGIWNILLGSLWCSLGVSTQFPLSDLSYCKQPQFSPSELPLKCFGHETISFFFVLSFVFCVLARAGLSEDSYRENYKNHCASCPCWLYSSKEAQKFQHQKHKDTKYPLSNCLELGNVQLVQVQKLFPMFGTAVTCLMVPIISVSCFNGCSLVVSCESGIGVDSH